MKSSHIVENLKKRTLGGFKVKVVKVGDDGIDEAHDPKFLSFMNKTLGQKVDTDTKVSNPSNVVTTGLSTMPEVRNAIKFGLSVMSLASKNPMTKAKMLSVDNDQVIDIIVTVASRSDRLNKEFTESDVVRAQDFLADILYDDKIQTWQDVIKHRVRINPIKENAGGSQVYAKIPGFNEYKMFLSDVASEKEFIDTWNRLPSEFRDLFGGRHPLWRGTNEPGFREAKPVKTTLKKYINVIAEMVVQNFRLSQQEKDKLAQQEKDKLDQMSKKAQSFSGSNMAAYRYAFMTAKKLKTDLDRFQQLTSEIEKLRKDITKAFNDIDNLGYQFDSEHPALIKDKTDPDKGPETLGESQLAAYRYASLLAKKLKSDLSRYKQVAVDDDEIVTAGELLRRISRRRMVSPQAIENLKKEIDKGRKDIESLGYEFDLKSPTLLKEDELLDSPQLVAKNLLKNIRRYRQLVDTQTPIAMRDLIRLKQDIIDGYDDLNSMGYKFDAVSPNLTSRIYEALGLDAPHRRLDREELHQYLDRIKKGEKTKQDKFAPIVHKSNIKAITKSDNIEDAWDLDDLASQITTRPKAILGTNAKMEKSATEGEIVYDLTLPALKGLVIDEETGDFVEITTCPGAGECQLFCYARKGGYVMFPASSMSAAQALNFLVNDPVGYSAKVNREIQSTKKKTDKHGIKLVVRWHDAGDFFSKEYLDLAYDVARANPDVDFYAYTKMGDVAISDKPENFIINFSSGSKRGEEKKIEIHKSKGNIVKQGITIPKDLFFDLIARDGNKLIKDEKGRTQFKDQESLETFKERLAKTYNVDPATIITYDQMLTIPVSDTPTWNVIVQPGAGDRAANRRDVIDSYLMFH